MSAIKTMLGGVLDAFLVVGSVSLLPLIVAGLLLGEPIEAWRAIGYLVVSAAFMVFGLAAAYVVRTAVDELIERYDEEDE